MKTFFKFALLSSAIFSMSHVFALPATITNNVIILQNATPGQCQAAARGIASPEDVVSDSMYGDFTGTTGAGVQSCTGCAVDANKNCVCNACYDYYN